MIRLIAVLAFSAFPGLAHAAVPDPDRQLWSELDVTYRTATRWSATAILTTRLGDAVPDPTLSAGGLQLDRRAGSWTASAAGYYVSIRRPDSGARASIWLPAAALSDAIRVGQLELSDRNRVERLDGVQGSPVRYRNRVSLYWHAPRSMPVAGVFLSDEAFYDFASGQWIRNRAQAGIELPVRADAKLQLSYIRQSTRGAAAGRLDVLGLTLQWLVN